MWLVLVEFHAASTEGSWRIKKKKIDRRIAVKPKSGGFGLIKSDAVGDMAASVIVKDGQKLETNGRV